MASNVLIHSEILLPSEAEMEFFSDSLFPFSDSAIDTLQAFSDNSPDEISVQNFDSLDHFSSSLLSASPPSHQLESSTIYHSHNFAETSNFRNGYADFSPVHSLEMKNEEHNSNSEPVHDMNPCFAPNCHNEAKYLQRSFSRGSFDDNPGFFFRPPLDALMESANIHVPSEKSPSVTFRLIFENLSTQNQDQKQRSSFSSSVASERSLMEEISLKAERYNPEERKERISKYRAKRTQRNFNKNIKYACRKTLADNRPRLRGRFARSDEPGESPKAACSAIEDDDDLHWNQDEEERTRRRGEFVNMEFNYYAP